MRRLERSAQFFGIALDRDATAEVLRDVQSAVDLRCRLTLAANGEVGLTTAPLAPASRRWNVSLAKQRVRSDDPWLRHKTTKRGLYDQVRASLPLGVDELLFLNERDEVCEGTITNLFVTLQNGQRVTPPLTSGLLPGVLRQCLLDQGELVEQVVTKQDLRQARGISLGNSLRGEIPSELHF
ncbi:hypothetical protein RSK20926_14549 [Roseobacter sp. SK209-2-6]|nr:hypothetical protein RSK20926_14549 [Roseobacter sp. SK209-2-6]